MSTTERQAGTYARERYQAGLRRYRRRIRRYYWILLVTATVPYVAVWLTRGLDWWSFTTGLIAGGLMSLAITMRDEPPELVAKWARGADGEQQTATAIEPLLEQGWKLRHDIDLGRGNADHVLLSPTGVVYLLETKNLAGTITIGTGSSPAATRTTHSRCDETTCVPACGSSRDDSRRSGLATADDRLHRSGRSSSSGATSRRTSS
jgi:hypothetical protein